LRAAPIEALNSRNRNDHGGPLASEDNNLLLVSDPLLRSVLQETLELEGNMILVTGDLGQAVDRLKGTSSYLLIARTYVQNIPSHEAAMYLCTKCPGMRVPMGGGRLMTRGFAIDQSCKELKSFQSHIARQTCSKSEGRPE
jgi:hypothetical protein